MSRCRRRRHSTPPSTTSTPPPGVAAKIGFVVVGVPVSVDVRRRIPTPPTTSSPASTNISQAVVFYGAELTLWGNPGQTPPTTPIAASAAANRSAKAAQSPSPMCPSSPCRTRCDRAAAHAPSKPTPGRTPASAVSETIQTHDDAEPPNPLGINGCAKLGFAPQIDAQPTTDQAESPSGLDFDLDIHDEGLTNPGGIAGSDIKKAVVTLPEGVTVNPSQAEGLGVCSEADLGRGDAPARTRRRLPGGLQDRHGRSRNPAA